MSTHPDLGLSPHPVEANFGEMKSKRKHPEEKPEVGRARDGLKPRDILRIADETKRRLNEDKKKTIDPNVIVNPSASPTKTGPINPDGSGLPAKDQG